MLAFAAAGLPPFGEGSGHDVFYRIVHQNPDLSALQAVDPALAALVESCLAKEPADRPSAAELVSFSSANTLPGPVAWPCVAAERIAERRAFAAAAPVAEFDGTELESSWIGELGRLPVPTPQPAADDANAEAETEPVPPKSPNSLEVIPGPASISQHRPRRSRKTLTLFLPLLLLLGGTTGAVFAIAPWTTNSASGGDNGAKIVTTGTSSTSGVSSSPTATSSLTATASAKPSAKTSSATPKKSRTKTTGGSTGGGSGSGGSSGGTSTKTTAPSTTKTTAAAKPPAAPTGLTLTVPDWFGVASLDVSWDSESGITEFELVIVNSGSDIYLSKTTTSYQINGIPAGTTECVKLRAINSAGNSAWASGCQNVG